MKKSIPEIRERVKQMSEKELRKTLCLIFDSLGLFEVTESHGTQEFGKDIVFYDKDKLGNETWSACVVKINDVNQSSYENIIRQINECFRKKYPSTSKGNVKIDNVYVITNGAYKDNAKSQIAESIDENKKQIHFWTDSDIAKKIENNDHLLNILFGSEDLINNMYREHVSLLLSKDNGMRILESDFDVKIKSVEDFHIKVRAKAKQFEIERGEYLKAIDVPFKNIPNDFLPDIEGILLNNKYIILHGIATSGKSTILKKIGKDFLIKEPDGLTFYYELNKIIEDLHSFELKDIICTDYLRITKTQIDLNYFEENNKNILILLDGLDEILNDSNRDIILDKIINSWIQVINATLI